MTLAPNNDAPTNVLVFLHGLGDKHDSFTKLGQQLNLPETVCISVQGPQGLLDLGGFHWGEDIIFDSTSGGLDPDAGFKTTTKLLRSVVEDALVEKCGYSPREIVFFGFGQGGMAALNVAGSPSHPIQSAWTVLTNSQLLSTNPQKKHHHQNSEV